MSNKKPGRPKKKKVCKVCSEPIELDRLEKQKYTQYCENCSKFRSLTFLLPNKVKSLNSTNINLILKRAKAIEEDYLKYEVSFRDLANQYDTSPAGICRLFKILNLKRKTKEEIKNIKDKKIREFYNNYKNIRAQIKESLKKNKYFVNLKGKALLKKKINFFPKIALYNKKSLTIIETPEFVEQNKEKYKEVLESISKFNREQRSSFPISFRVIDVSKEKAFGHKFNPISIKERYKVFETHKLFAIS